MTTKHLNEQFPRVWTSKLFTGWNCGAQYIHAYRERKFPDDIEFIQLAEHHQLQAQTLEKLREARSIIDRMLPWICIDERASDCKISSDEIYNTLAEIDELLSSSEDLSGKGGL